MMLFHAVVGDASPNSVTGVAVNVATVVMTMMIGRAVSINRLMAVRTVFDFDCLFERSYAFAKKDIVLVRDFNATEFQNVLDCVGNERFDTSWIVAFDVNVEGYLPNRCRLNIANFCDFHLNSLPKGLKCIIVCDEVVYGTAKLKGHEA
jgi:hypothetical protein